jgi:ribonuclease BN (tRNA processing enzyme)
MLVRIVGGHGGVSPGFRNTSYLIDGRLLIDAGSVASGLQIDEQLLIDHILISHSHLDHICELAFLADNCFGQKDRPFEIYTCETVRKNIMTHLLNDEIWPDFTSLPNRLNPTLRFHNLPTQKTIQLGPYKITSVKVNHPAGGHGFIVEKKNCTLLFTQDSGPTDEIWEVGKKQENLKAIFTEVSFPNKLKSVADASFHHTPSTIAQEIKKMPKEVPVFLGHLKPNYQSDISREIDELKEERISLLASDDISYVF